jgi:hypothetical protein
MSEADEFAMALAKARRSGIALRSPKRASAKTRLVLEREVTRAKKPRRVSRRRARAAIIALEGRKAASPRPLARAARTASAKRKATRKTSGARKASSARKPMRRSRSRMR